MNKTKPENPYIIKEKLQLASERRTKGVSQGIFGVVISSFEKILTSEQRYYVWWWLFDGGGEPKELHTNQLTPAQKKALVSWCDPERFEAGNKVQWLPQQFFFQELKSIWYEVWKELICNGIVVMEKKCWSYQKQENLL